MFEQITSVITFILFSSTDGDIAVRLDTIVSAEQQHPEDRTCMLRLSNGQTYEVAGTLQEVCNKITNKK